VKFPPLPNGKVPFEHQKELVENLLSTKKAVGAYDMGLGKTLAAIIASKFTGLKTHCVAPASIIFNWQDELKAVEASHVELHSWAKIPKSIAGDFCLIGDEAHFAQQIESLRAKAFLNLAERAKYVFLLTGTPMRNGRPSNLFTLLKACDHPLGKDKKEYETRYCGGRYNVMGGAEFDGKNVKWECRNCGWTNDEKHHWRSPIIRCSNCKDARDNFKIFWKNDGATNLEELNASIKSVVFRKTKEQCLDLPTKTRVLQKAEISKEGRDCYHAILNECREKYRQRIESKEIKSEGEALAILTFIRKAASTAKIESSIDLAESVLNQGSQVVIFTDFVDSAERLAKAFETRAITGKITDNNVRREIIGQFQAGKNKVLVGTGDSAGTGTNLTAANYIILHDRPMTSGDAMQWEDRVHRIGQHWPVTCYWLQAFEVDEKIDEQLEGKQNVTATVLGDENFTQVKKSFSALKVLKGLFS